MRFFILTLLLISQSAGAAIRANPQGISYEASATAATTTTSGTNSVMSGMTITPAAGNYLVLFSGWCTHNSNGDTITISIFNNGSQVTASIRTILPRITSSFGTPAASDMAVMTNGVVTATGSGAVTIDWSTTGATATCTNRTLDLIRLK